MADLIFTPTFRKYTDPLDLQVAAGVYNTLEQGHQTAIAQESAIATELNKLDLNEAEDEWRAQQINKVQSALTDNMRYGNAYSSLDNVIRTGTQIFSNPGMQGRLRAQKDYKAYMEELDKSNLPEDYKTYYKAHNQYNYSDVLDNKGNVIGGTKWTPTDPFVDSVPLIAIQEAALKMVAKEKGGGSSTRWLDANGNVTDDPTKSITGEIFSTTTGQWETVSKEKLSAAVAAVIESTPDAKASLQQDYKIAKWKYDNNNGVNPDITDKSGNLLSPEQYLQKRLDPFYKAATYFNQTSTTQYGDAVKAQIALAKKNTVGTGSTSYKNRADVLQTTTNPVTFENFVPIETQKEINIAKQSLIDLIKQENPNSNFIIDGKTDEELINYVSNIKNPTIKANALAQLEVIQDGNEYLQQIQENIVSPEQKQQFEAYVAINSMSDLPAGTNSYYDDYIKLRNTYWQNASSLRTYFSDNDIYDEFISQIGGKNNAKSLGIKFGSKNGKKFVELPREYMNSTYAFGTAIRNAIDTRNVFGKGWQDFKNMFNSSAGDNVMRINSDGTESPIYLSETIYNRTQSTNNQGDWIFSNIVNTVDNLKQSYDNTLQGGVLTLSQQAIAQPSANAAEIAFMMRENPTEAGKLTAAYNLEKSEALNAIRGIDLTQTGAYLVGDNNMYESIDSEKRKELTTLLRNAKDTDIDILAIQDPKSGQWSPLITVRSGTGEKVKSETFYAPGGFNSVTVESWNKDTTFRAKNYINVYGSAGRDINITNVSAFANIDKLSLRKQGDNYEVINKTYNTNLGLIDTATAVELRDMYYRWNDTYNYVKSGVIAANDPAIQGMAIQVGTELAKLFGSGNNQAVIEYYATNLINNLISK